MFQKKSLGQNFLKNKAIVKKIVSIGDLKKDEIVIEIGPGRGVMTEELLKAGAQVIAIEKDDRLISELSEKFSLEIAEKRLVIIHDSIENIDLKKLGLGSFKYKLIANIPYYITGQIIKMFLESEIQPERIVILVQKEVAERIVAKDKKESLLSISVKVYGNPSKEGIVKAGNFSPAPKVDSTILLIDNISKNNFDKNGISPTDFFEIVKKGFAEKRKVLLPKLNHYKEKSELEKIFAKIGLDTKARAENLTLDDWIKLAKEIKG